MPIRKFNIQDLINSKVEERNSCKALSREFGDFLLDLPCVARLFSERIANYNDAAYRDSCKNSLTE